MEIYDCDYEGDNKDINKELNANIMCINAGDSYGTTDVEWDPTGRYIATSSSSWKHGVSDFFISTNNRLKTATKSVISKAQYYMKPTWNDSNSSHGVQDHLPSSPKNNNARSAVVSGTSVVNSRLRMKLKLLVQVRNFFNFVDDYWRNGLLGERESRRLWRVRRWRRWKMV